MAWKTPEQREAQAEKFKKWYKEILYSATQNLKLKIEAEERLKKAEEFLNNHPKKGR